MNDLVFIKSDDQYIIRGKYIISSLELFNKKHQRPYLCYQGKCKSGLFPEELTNKGGFGAEHSPIPLLSLLVTEGEEALKEELLRRHSIMEAMYIEEFDDVPEVNNPSFQLTNARAYKLDRGLISISGKYLQLLYLRDEGCVVFSAQKSKATLYKNTYKSYHNGYNLDAINRIMNNSYLDLFNTLKFLYNRSLDELLKEIEDPALYDSIYNKEEKDKRLNPSGFLENCLTKESA